MTSADSDCLGNNGELKKFLDDAKKFIEDVGKSVKLEKELSETRDQLLDFYDDAGYFSIYPREDEIAEEEEEEEEMNDYDDLGGEVDHEAARKQTKMVSERADELSAVASMSGYLTHKRGWFRKEKIFVLIYKGNLYMFEKITSTKYEKKISLIGGQFKV